MKLFSILITILLISGCSTIRSIMGAPDCSHGSACESAIISSAVKPNQVSRGVIYSIPKQNLKLTVSRLKLTEKKLEDDAKKKEAALDKRKEELGNVEKLIKDLESKQGKSNHKPATDKITLDLELAKLDQLILKGKVLSAQKQKAEADDKLRAWKDNPKSYEVNFSLEPLTPHPDPNLKLVAYIDDGLFSSETFEIKTTDAGLLSGGITKSEGNVDEVFVSLAGAIGAFSPSPATSLIPKNFISLLNSFDGQQSPPECPQIEKEVTYILDPENPDWKTELNKKLEFEGFCYEADGPVVAANDKISLSGNYDGLVYPRKESKKFTFTNTKNSIINESIEVQMVSATSLGYIPMKRGVFATNEYEFEFSNGLLTRYKTVSPNELVAALSTIPDAAKALIQIPAELIKLRVDYSSSEAAYYESLASVLEAKRALENAKNGIFSTSENDEGGTDEDATE